MLPVPASSQTPPSCNRDVLCDGSFRKSYLIGERESHPLAGENRLWIFRNFGTGLVPPGGQVGILDVFGISCFLVSEISTDTKEAIERRAPHRETRQAVTRAGKLDDLFESERLERSAHMVRDGKTRLSKQ